MDTPPAIIDGDTIRLGSEIIRLSNIVEPEMGWRAECDAERFLAEASKDRIEAILTAPGKLQIDREGTDFYGRTLARIRCVYRKLDSAENGPVSLVVFGSAHAAERS